MSYSDDSLPISALQHWLFCARQCALIHVERLWSENQQTAEGRLLHERTDSGENGSKSGSRILRSVQLVSVALGVHGVSDVVEIQGDRPYPVEYKRGRPKAHLADEVQLCAQAICLEEMTGYEIIEGALFYGKRKRRTVITLNEELRALTAAVAADARTSLFSGILPKPVYEPARCDACSMQNLCRPKVPDNRSHNWLAQRIDRSSVPE